MMALEKYVIMELVQRSKWLHRPMWKLKDEVIGPILASKQQQKLPFS